LFNDPLGQAEVPKIKDPSHLCAAHQSKPGVSAAEGQGREDTVKKRQLGVSKNREKKPKLSILLGFSIIFTIHFGIPLFFGNTQFKQEDSDTQDASLVAGWPNPSEKYVRQNGNLPQG